MENNTQPITCDAVRHAIPEILDGELNDKDTARVVAHLAECESCSELAARETALRRRLAEGLRDNEDPDALWRRVGLALDAHDAASEHYAAVSEPAPSSARRNFMRLGLAASVLLAGAVALYSVPPRHRPDLVAETVNDFLTFRASGQNLHIEQQDPKRVKIWLETRVDFDIAVTAAPPEGFRLAGGRLCSFLGRHLAFLHYRDGDNSAALYVMRGEDLNLPASESSRIDGRDVTVTTARGIVNVAWRDGGLVYALVTNLPKPRALAVAAEM